MGLVNKKYNTDIEKKSAESKTRRLSNDEILTLPFVTHRPKVTGEGTLLKVHFVSPVIFFVQAKSGI